MSLHRGEVLPNVHYSSHVAIDLLREQGYSNEARDMVLVFLREHPSSFPRVVCEEYVHDNGDVEFLVKMMGGVSIVYQSKHYKLPAYMILPREFPQVAPLCYMNPNETMVRNTKCPHVDANFCVRTDYMSAWAYPFSNLCQMYEDLKEKFSVAPPLKNNNKLAGRPEPPRHTNLFQVDDVVNFGGASASSSYEGFRNDTRQAALSRKQKLGEDAMKKMLAYRLCDALNDRLIEDYENQMNTLSSLKQKSDELQRELESLQEERKLLDGCISDFSSTITKLDVWLQREEPKAKDINRARSMDAYDAIVTVDRRSKDILESDACIRAVHDAMKHLDDALSESRISWTEYKRMLSKLAFIKFQAKILNKKAKNDSGHNQPQHSPVSQQHAFVPSYPVLQESLAPIEDAEFDIDNPLLRMK
jgi:hypothetical protein